MSNDFSPFSLIGVTPSEEELQEGDVSMEELEVSVQDDPDTTQEVSDEMRVTLEEMQISINNEPIVTTEGLDSEAPLMEQVQGQQRIGQCIALDEKALKVYDMQGYTLVEILARPKTPLYSGWLLNNIAFNTKPIKLVIQACLPASYWMALYNAVTLCQQPVTLVVGYLGDLPALALLEAADQVELSPASLVVVQSVTMNISGASFSGNDTTSMMEYQNQICQFVKERVVDRLKLMSEQEFATITKSDRVLALFGDNLKARLGGKVVSE